ncbi:MAG: hypothetical protein KKB66_18475 [Alphaproteobacteria bacterium]|uniref:Uncharacterized protein n=1 Tax=viral metagenome TaxID=1070528 RepID=A0A6H1ZFI0_9ZZZZ|nr:hypothetical protein [Alphaproteobacteria bacterium]MBU0803590.1 hypothetical protein [Alphaproteobacteria bacterium]MBU0873113.1 hypothetical protein [Alphaproteobacteria bacterium]MBU1402517.1 hypothetical protein [Alphaproteobacteria bacterium]MBU1593159.1 hypothetical protein [Alphaproteobacteria bacterium]
MITLSGLFDSYGEAKLAVHDLEDAGISSDEITLLSKKADSSDEGDLKTAGAGVGVAIGGVGGLLAGMAGLSIPGVGTLFGTGWLISAFIGAAAGGVAGGIVAAMIECGINENDAHVFAEGVNRGGALVTIKVHEHEMDIVKRILKRHHSVDLAKRRREYEEDGWSGFTSSDPWDDRIGREDD